MRRARRISAMTFLAAAAAALALAGCAKVRGSFAPNRPPVAVLWVNGPVDTVAHTIRAYWSGQDPDGKVTGFEFKWVYAPGSAPADYDSSRWSWTVRTDSLFTVFAPDGLDFPTLALRAVDDSPDGSPEADGADHGTHGDEVRQSFAFSNAAPGVRFTGTPPDSTLPVAVIDWQGFDPDGPIAKATYRIWLDGAEDRAIVVDGTQFTLPPPFFDPAGVTETRRRTVYVQAIDVGGRASLPDSFSWVVRAPVGNTLLVDDVPALAGASTYDTFYRSELNTRLGSGNYTVLDLEKGAYLPTEAAIRETFLLFQNVFWYSEINPGVSTVLQQADQPIRDYLSAGRNLYVTSSRLVGTGGALGGDEAFIREVLGVAEVRENLGSGTTGFTITPGQFVVGGQAPFDSLQSTGIFANVEAFVLADPGEAAYLAPPGTLDTLHVDDWPLGVSRRYGAGQGHLVYLSFPLRGMNSSFSGQAGRAATELRKVFDLFGL